MGRSRPLLPLDASRSVLLSGRCQATLTTPVHDQGTSANQANTGKAANHHACDGTSRQPAAALSGRCRTRARAGRRRGARLAALVSAGRRRVEAHGRAGARVGDGADVRDIGAGVKGLVLGLVKVGNVLDLEGCVAAGAYGRRGIGHVDARVAQVHLAKGGGADDLDKVVVALWVLLNSSVKVAKVDGMGGLPDL